MSLHEARALEPPSGRRKAVLTPALAGAVVFLVAAALYLPTPRHDFVWDDLSIVMANESLGDWSRLGSNLAPGFFHESSGPRLRDYWRPLVVLSHMVDRTLFGEAAGGPHLVNVLLHATASVFVLMLCHAWSGRLGCSLVAGLLFAVHPVHVEVVAWVSGRSDLLLGLFLTVALWADRRYGSTGRARWLMVALAGFALALLSKEAAVVFPLLVAARVLLESRPAPPGGGRRVATSIASSLAVLALFFWTRYGLLDAAVPEGLAAAADRSALFWTWWSAFALYLELLVWPARLAILHDLGLENGFWAPRVAAGCAVFAAMVLACWRLRRRAPVAAFGIAVLLVGLAPVSGFLVPVAAPGGAAFPAAERFLYFPSVGFCLFTAWILAAWLPARLRSFAGTAAQVGAGGRHGPLRVELVVGVLVGVLVLAAAVRSHDRIRDWRSDLSLFATAVRDSPGSYLAHLNYASALASAAGAAADPESGQSRLDAARRHYLEAERIAPENYRIPYDLGNLYRSMGRLEEAAASYRRALVLHPGLHQAWINLGTVQAQQGALEGALASFEAADRLQPRLAATKVNRAHVLQMLGRPEEAIGLYQEALALEPGLFAARDGLERARRAIALREPAATGPE